MRIQFIAFSVYEYLLIFIQNSPSEDIASICAQLISKTSIDSGCCGAIIEGQQSEICEKHVLTFPFAFAIKASKTCTSITLLSYGRLNGFELHEFASFRMWSNIKFKNLVTQHCIYLFFLSMNCTCWGFLFQISIV